MNNKFDTIIVGAGIAGLLTAIRLSQHGQKVLIVEREKVGSGATSSNHGMIHSGALFVRHHGHIVQKCQEAQKLFLNLVPEAEIKTKMSVYISSEKNTNEFIELLENYGLKYERISAGKVFEIKPQFSIRYEYLGIKERIFSSAMILEILTSYCLVNKVEFLLGNKISKILKENHRVIGVETGRNHISARNVIIATGLGTPQLLESFNSYYGQFLRSRLDMMVYLPNANLARGLVFAQINRPVIMPAKVNGALASFFGGKQPPINGDRKYAVDFDNARLLLKMIGLFFNKEIVSVENAYFYMSGKTDYVGNEHTEKGFINPGFHIIDHAKFDRVKNLYTIATGKMVLAFHASKAVADLVLGVNLDLTINESSKVTPPDDMFAVEPWASTDKI